MIENSGKQRDPDDRTKRADPRHDQGQGGDGASATRSAGSRGQGRREVRMRPISSLIHQLNRSALRRNQQGPVGTTRSSATTSGSRLREYLKHGPLRSRSTGVGNED